MARTILTELWKYIGFLSKKIVMKIFKMYLEAIKTQKQRLLKKKALFVCHTWTPTENAFLNKIISIFLYGFSFKYHTFIFIAGM